jgi:hypothetical protein
MPLVTYFSNVGAALLVLLLIADLYLPGAPAVQNAAAYPPVIRIRAEQKWPERVVFDTSAPIIATNPAASERKLEVLPIADAAPTSNVVTPALRDVFAIMPRADSRHSESVTSNKRQLKQKTAARSGRRYGRQQVVLAWPAPQFAWFGYRRW